MALATTLTGRAARSYSTALPASLASWLRIAADISKGRIADPLERAFKTAQAGRWIALPADEIPDNAANAQAYPDSRFGPGAVARLRAAFDRSRHPMLIADDQRRWVTGNAAACDLLGLTPAEIPWRKMDEFTPPSERVSLEQKWAAFLASGEAEGGFQLYIPHRGAVPIEFSATANVMPARHLSVLSPSEEDALQTGAERPSQEEPWTPVVVEGSERLQLTEREREVMTLVASGLHGGEIAERLFLSPETVKSHVHNAMRRLRPARVRTLWRSPW